MKTFVNSTRRALQRGAVRIPAGGCRGVADADLLPTDRVDSIHAYPAAETATVTPTVAPPINLSGLLEGNIKSVLTALDSLTDDQLAEIEALEEQGQSRQGVREGLAAEKVKRAEEAQTLATMIDELRLASAEQLAELAELHAEDTTLLEAINAEQQARAEA